LNQFMIPSSIDLSTRPSCVRPIISVLQSGHNDCFFAQHVDKPLDTLCLAKDYFDREAPGDLR
jgi:hypothetical protein